MRVISMLGLPVRSETGDGASGLHYRGPIDAETLRLNHVEIDPGGMSRAHHHAWEQINYVLSGSGVLVCGAEETAVSAGDAVLVDRDERHLFRNDGDTPLVLLGVLGPESVGQ